VPTIAGDLRRHFRDRCWTVRPPRGVGELMLQVYKATSELGARLGRPPTVREIGQALEVADEVVLEAWQARRDLTCTSLNEHGSGHDESDATRQDAIGIEDAGFLRVQQRATIDQLTVVLTERERRVLKLRFDEDLTQEQIGQCIGVSQMQVSRLIRGALAKLAEAASRP